VSIKRLDPSKPEDLAELVSTGLIWQATVPAQYKDMAVDALVEGRLPLGPDIPADALAEVNRMRDAMGAEPLVAPTVAEEAPVEPPIA
jgi:hypothetical protein